MCDTYNIFRTVYFISTYIVGFITSLFIKSFRPFHSFWEEKDLSRDINTSFTVWQHYRYHEYSVSGPSSQQGSGIPFKLLCLFSSIIFLLITKKKKKKKKKKPFSRQSVIKVPNQCRTHMTFSYKRQAKTYTWPDLAIDRLHWCAKQRNRTSVLLGELWSGHLVLTAHNWQKWKRVFPTCHCHKIYRDEAVGLKSCKNTWKITIFVKMWNLGQYRENFVKNCLIKARI